MTIRRDLQFRAMSTERPKLNKINQCKGILILSIAFVVAVMSRRSVGLSIDRITSIPHCCRGISTIALRASQQQEQNDVSSSTTDDSGRNDEMRQKRQEQFAPNKKSSDLKQKRVALLLCPAQFCVPDDYKELWQELPLEVEWNNNTSSIRIDRELSRVVPLSRRDWIKVSKQLPTTEFWNANLAVHKTLDWYFDALEEGLAQIWMENNRKRQNDIDDELTVCLVGHSIGGWVARAYLGGLSRSSTSVSRLAQERISSLITLGTPHSSPPTALVDQTRGLLKEIAEAPGCSSQTLIEKRGIDVTCVCSSSLAGRFVTTNVEEFVAASSYLPLLGRSGGDVLGDGIVPLDLAFMEAPARRVIVPACPETGRPVRHSHVLPTPWNLWEGYAPSIQLNDGNAVSYVSPAIVSQWAQFIR